MLYFRAMTTTLQDWGESQGLRLPKALLDALELKTGASVEVTLSPKGDAIILKAAKPGAPVRGPHRIEDLAAAMPSDYKAAEFEWGTSGREVW